MPGAETAGLKVLPSDTEGNIHSAGLLACQTRRIWDLPCKAATGAGNQQLGRILPLEGGSASSFSASPSANPVGGRKRYAATFPHIAACRVPARGGMPCPGNGARLVGRRQPERRALPAREEGEDRERPRRRAARRSGPD